VLREIVITDPDGNSLTPVAFQSFEECPFPEEIKEEVPGSRVSGYHSPGFVL